MRTTIRIDDDLLMQLKSRARQERLSLGQTLNRIIRSGLNASVAGARPVPCYREKVMAMGAPSENLDKALTLWFTLEEAEIARKLGQRK